MYGKGDQALRSIWQKLSARVFPAKGLDIFQGKPASSPARRQPSQPALEGDGAFYGQVRPPLPTEPVLAEGQGLVQLPPHWTGSNLRLWVDDRETKWQGKPLVLEQGYHEIRVRLGGSLSQRFIVVQAGKVHVLD